MVKFRNKNGKNRLMILRRWNRLSKMMRMGHKGCRHKCNNIPINRNNLLNLKN